MCQIARLGFIGLVAVVTGFASSGHAAAQELPLGMVERSGIPDGRGINSYESAVDAIMRVMVQRFQLPVPRGKLLIYATREDFELGLVEQLKIAPGLARSTARFAKSAVGSCNVLVNGPAVSDLSWPQRIELLAHELMHSAQLTLANRCGLTRQQWLIEGSAEWMAFNVTASLQLDDLNDVRARLADKVRTLGRKGDLPRLTQLDSFDEWVNARDKYGFNGTYSLSFLVTDFLVARHSFARLADYFRRYEHSSDHLANFSVAFGEGVEDFERALEVHLSELIK